MRTGGKVHSWKNTRRLTGTNKWDGPLAVRRQRQSKKGNMQRPIHTVLNTANEEHYYCQWMLHIEALHELCCPLKEMIPGRQHTRRNQSLQVGHVMGKAAEEGGGCGTTHARARVEIQSRKHLRLRCFVVGIRTARIASSNTIFRPSWVKAEHSI